MSYTNIFLNLGKLHWKKGFKPLNTRPEIYLGYRLWKMHITVTWDRNQRLNFALVCMAFCVFFHVYLWIRCLGTSWMPIYYARQLLLFSASIMITSGYFIYQLMNLGFSGWWHFILFHFSIIIMKSFLQNVFPMHSCFRTCALGTVTLETFQTVSW